MTSRWKPAKRLPTASRWWSPRPPGRARPWSPRRRSILAMSAGRRAFYTTPIKALSNQKYSDLVGIYGPERVGLLTGDNVVNGDAAIVVMTTEVLRNMIYADSSRLAMVDIVILDEVHFLQDRTRGAVWEEVIIHCPQQVQMVCLSATVSNNEEFAAWVGERRGPTRLVATDHRPVPLESMYMIKDKMGSQTLHLLPTFVRRDGRTRPNPRVEHMLGLERGRRRRFKTPNRIETVERLAQESMLPAIYFIFSRAGCDAATHRLLDAGLRLTDVTERAAIREVAEKRTEHLGDDDLAVLGYDRWLAGSRSRSGSSSRRAGPGVQGDRRGTVRGRPAQGGLRHRDAGPRDQHAGQDGGSGDPLQIQRRVARADEAGRLHPTDRAGRAKRDRCRGLRGSAPFALRQIRPCHRGGLDRLPPTSIQLPAHLQHDGQPGGQLWPGRSRTAARGLIRQLSAGGRPSGEPKRRSTPSSTNWRARRPRPSASGEMSRSTSPWSSRSSRSPLQRPNRLLPETAARCWMFPGAHETVAISCCAVWLARTTGPAIW